MDNVYIVIERDTQRACFGKTYVSERYAKLALKHNVHPRKWPLYAVASVKIVPTIVATVNDAGKWTAVSAE